MWVFALILALPLIEIGLFVTLGGAIGLWGTLGFVLGSAMLGVALLRRGAVAAQTTGNPMVQIAGVGFTVMSSMLLIVPGFLTSFMGVLLLIPFVQRGVIILIGQRLTARGAAFTRRTAGKDDVIDGAFTVVPEQNDDILPSSKWTRD